MLAEDIRFLGQREKKNFITVWPLDYVYCMPPLAPLTSKDPQGYAEDSEGMLYQTLRNSPLSFEDSAVF